METKLNLKQKLVAIRKSIGVLQKTENGNQGAKYVDPGVILLKMRDSMDKLNVLLTVEVKSYKNSQVIAPTSKNPNNMDYLSEIELYYTWYNADTDESLGCPWHSVGSHMQDPSMAFGGGLTFAERYFLLKFFQVPTSKDDPEHLTAKAGLTPLVTEDQIANMNALIDEVKADRIKFLAVMGVAKIEDMYLSNYDLAISKLELKRDYKK
jgi:hypothetical protein